MCMALRMIKQGGDEKMKVYYEHIFKLANCFQHQEDSLLTTFFQTCSQPYLWIATMGIKRDKPCSNTNKLQSLMKKKWETPMNTKYCWNHQPSGRKLVKEGK